MRGVKAVCHLNADSSEPQHFSTAPQEPGHGSPTSSGCLLTKSAYKITTLIISQDLQDSCPCEAIMTSLQDCSGRCLQEHLTWFPDIAVFSQHNW